MWDNKQASYLVGMVIVFTLAVLTAIVGAEPVEIEVWCEPVHATAFQSVIEEFHQAQDRVRVTMVYREPAPDELIQVFLAGVAPDVIWSSTSWEANYAINGLLAELDPLIALEDPGFLRDFGPGLLQRVNGHLYGIPVVAQIEGFYYNEYVFERRGLAPPDPNWTITDLEQILRKIPEFDSEGNQTTFGLVCNYLVQLPALTGQMGLILINEDYDVIPDEKTFSDALKWCFDMVQKGAFHYQRHGFVNDNDYAYNTGLAIDGTYRQGFWDSLAAPMRVIPPPRRFLDEVPKALFGYRSWAIVSSTPLEKREACWEFIKFTIQKDNLMKVVEALGFTPSTISTASSDELHHYAMVKNPNMLRWASHYLQLEALQIFPMEVMPLVAPVFHRVQADIYNGTLGISAGIESLRHELGIILDEFKDNL